MYINMDLFQLQKLKGANKNDLFKGIRRNV